MVEIETRTMGKKSSWEPGWSVPILDEPEAGEEHELTLRELIERIVRSEVLAFRKRQSDRRFVRFLSEREIEAGRVRGKIETGGSGLAQDVDEEEAVHCALQAFEDGVYLVFLDGVEQKELERQVFVTEESRVMFVRLMFLAGG